MCEHNRGGTRARPTTHDGAIGYQAASRRETFADGVPAPVAPCGAYWPGEDRHSRRRFVPWLALRGDERFCRDSGVAAVAQCGWALVVGRDVGYGGQRTGDGVL